MTRPLPQWLNDLAQMHKGGHFLIASLRSWGRGASIADAVRMMVECGGPETPHHRQTAVWWQPTADYLPRIDECGNVTCGEGARQIHPVD
jgi:hypothetical protein